MYGVIRKSFQGKFETWERELFDTLKRLNSRIIELRQERASSRTVVTRSTSHGRRLSRDSNSTKSSMLERKVDSAAKVAKLKTELLFADAEVKRIAALKVP